jgi:hypothetical protein
MGVFYTPAKHFFTLSDKKKDRKSYAVSAGNRDAIAELQKIFVLPN